MNGPLVALEGRLRPVAFSARGCGERGSDGRLYPEKGIDKLKICPPAGLSRGIRERRKGVEQSSAAH